MVQPGSGTNGEGGPANPHPEGGKKGKGREMGDGPKNKTAATICRGKLIY